MSQFSLELKSRSQRPNKRQLMGGEDASVPSKIPCLMMENAGQMAGARLKAQSLPSVHKTLGSVSSAVVSQV